MLVLVRPVVERIENSPMCLIGTEKHLEINKKKPLCRVLSVALLFSFLF